VFVVGFVFVVEIYFGLDVSGEFGG